MPEFLNESTLTVICINMLLAWSFWFPLACGQLSLASPGAAAIGAYTASRMAQGGTEEFVVLVLSAGLAGFVLMLVVSPLVLRLGGYSFALATLAIAEGIRLTINNIDFFGGPAGIAGTPTSDLALPLGIGFCVAVFLFSRAVFRSLVGRMVDALDSDELQAQALGMSTNPVKIFSLSMQGLVAGLAGGLLSGYLGYIDPSLFDIGLHIDIFAYAVVGGVTTFVGPFFGAAVLTIALDAFASIGNVRYIAFGLLLLVMIRVRRDGVLVRLRWLQRRRLSSLLRRATQGSSTVTVASVPRIGARSPWRDRT